MLVSLIGKEKIYKLILPSNVRGSYWITDRDGNEEIKLVNIEAVDGKWHIKSNSYAFVNTRNILDYDVKKVKSIPQKILDDVILEEYGLHIISVTGKSDEYLLFSSPVFEKDYFCMDIQEQSFTIGKGEVCGIVYNNILLSDRQADFTFENGKWCIENKDELNSIFVNDEKIYNKTPLNHGDIIFISGLKIIIIGNILYVNNIKGKIQFGSELAVKPNVKKPVGKLAPVEGEDEDIKIYSEEDYFSRSPKMIEKVEKELIKIDAPPATPNQDEMPTILAMGSSLSMSAMMMMSLYNALDGIMNKTASMKQSIMSLISSGAMLTGMLMMPILTRRFQRKQKKKFEKKRQIKYRKYINSKIVKVNEIMEKQKDILNKKYPTQSKCGQIILERSSRLWERKIEDSTFISIRLGTGEVPLDIDVQYPGDSFRMDDDDLVDIVGEIGQKSKTLEDAPITVSLIEKNISAIICDNNTIYDYIKKIVLQLVTMHNYIDLKLIFLVGEENYNKWDFVRMLPHVWDNSRVLRFLAKDDSDINDISKYLEIDLEKRIMKGNRESYTTYSPYYLIITDNYKKIENVKIISEILKIKKNMGFSLLCLTNDYTALPSECQTFITMNNNEGKILEIEEKVSTERAFKIEEDSKYNFSEIACVLSNIPIRYNAVGNEALPKKYTFLEMFDVGKIEQLNILDRWGNNDTTKSLKAEIGSDGSKKPIVLDVHEKYHGPHGLIAGSTGSGKSEFIITYILSLAINYHPDDVNFVLIDYKGGGLAGAFQKKDYKLPHLVGTITNIDKNGLERSLSSIQSELRKRQVMFNQARDMTDESTIDIYKYQKLYHDGIVKKPISHLFIICDEFAELKQQQPDFMDELISVARIGRSLGVHLILATQKPAGIVNDQIRSNSKFGISLKVQDKSDSMDVIKKPDAAFLKLAGQFYMNVGNDEYFVLGQSGWSGAPYEPKDVIKKDVDTAVDFIADDGNIIKKYDNPKPERKSEGIGDQLTNIVQYISNIAKQENIVEDKLWLDEIPDTIYVRALKKKYNVKVERNVIAPIIGEYDDPANQNQGVVTVNLSKEGNTVIYGSADSGKDGLLSTLIFDIITSHTSDEVQVYVMDFGAEALKKYKASPQVGDVITVNDAEKMSRVFSMLEDELKERKAFLSNYNGDYEYYIRNAENPMPMKLYIINNYAVFQENYAIYEEKLQSITRDCTKCGIVFLITANAYNEMRYKLTQNFKQKLSLQLNKDDDYMYIFEKVKKKRPSNIKGRGLVSIDGVVQEFQTAQIMRAEVVNEYIDEIIKKLNQISTIRAKTIPTIPDVVTFNMVKPALIGPESVPIGVATGNLKIAAVDFTKAHVNIISGKMSDEVFNFGANIVKEIISLKDKYSIVFDMENVCNKKFDYEKEMEKFNKIIEIGPKDGKIHNHICIIIGIEKFINKLSNGKDEFYEMLKKVENMYSVIIMDNAAKIKAYQYDMWYKNYISGDTGIWVGNGVDTQYLITTSATKKELVADCGRSQGFYINQGKVVLIKLLGIKGENNNE